MRHIYENFSIVNRCYKKKLTICHNVYTLECLIVINAHDTLVILANYL